MAEHVVAQALQGREGILVQPVCMEGSLAVLDDACVALECLSPAKVAP